MKPLLALTISSIKRYVRNFSSLVFSLLIPLFLIAIFGAFSNSTTQFNLGVLDQATTPASKILVDTLYCGNPVKCDHNNSDNKTNSPFKITEDNQDNLEKSLRKGDLSAVLIIPANFDGKSKSQLTFLENEGKVQDTGAMSLILSQILDNSFNISPADKKVTLAPQKFESKNLTEIDFLIPGILGFNILGTGIFGVAFAFVSYKSNGTFKRLLAMPITGRDIIISEGVARAIVLFVQLAIFIAVGYFAFGLKIEGSIFLVFLLCFFAIVIFLSIGFAIAGYAKDENQVAPLAQLVNLPMTFLSGTFFPRDIFPTWLRTITDYFPLTFLNDALRNVMNNGATLWDVRGQVLGLLVWCVLCLLLAFKVFRWN